MKARLDALEAVDHDAFLTEHQDISHLATKEEIPSVEGLASESFVEEKIAAIEIPECEKYDDTALVARVAALEALEHIMKPNFTYEIKMIEADKEPFVESAGDYPNIVLTFNIPMGTVSTEPEQPEEPVGEPKMWIGWIPFDMEAFENESAPTMGYSSPDHVNENMTMDILQFGINNGTVVEMEPQTLSKYSVPDIEDAGYIICVVPKESNYVVTVDNGFGTKVPFEDNAWQVPQNDLELVNKIDGITYCMFGGMVNIPSSWFLYVDEK